MLFCRKYLIIFLLLFFFPCYCQSQEIQFIKYQQEGDSLYQAWDLEKARVSYQKALQYSPKIESFAVFKINLNLGDVSTYLNEVDIALHYYKAAIFSFPKDTMAYDFARCYRNIGISMLRLSKFDSSMIVLNKAYELSLTHSYPKIECSTLKEIGNAYNYIGKTDSASWYYEKALRIAKKNGLTNFISDIYFELGNLYMDKGELQKSLEAYLKTDSCENVLGRTQYASTTLSCIGNLYLEWGIADKALEMFEKAEKLCIEAKDSVTLGVIKNNLGNVYGTWFVTEKAIDSYEEALNLLKRFGTIKQVALNYNNIGSQYSEAKKHDIAILYFDSALKIQEKIKDYLYISTTLNNIGNCYLAQKKIPEAESFFIKAYYYDSLSKRENTMPFRLSRLGLVNMFKGDFEKSESLLLQGISLSEKIAKPEAQIECLDHLGQLYLNTQQFEKAVKHLSKSVEIKEHIRQTAPIEGRMSYLNTQIVSYHNLIKTYIKTNQKENALQTIEACHSKVLSENLKHHNNADSIITISQIKKLIEKDNVFLVYSIMHSGSVVFVISSEADTIIHIGNEEAEMNLNIEEKSEYNYYQRLIKKYLQLISTPSLNDSLPHYSKELYNLLLNRVHSFFENKKEIIIVPDGPLGLLPFETLINKDGKTLSQIHSVRYVQSLSIYNILKSTNHRNAENNILLIGGAEYEPAKLTPCQDIPVNEKSLKYYRKTVENYNLLDTSFILLYNQMGFANWDNIPGTQKEIEGISKFYNKSLLLSGQKASESEIKKLSTSGELEKYRYIHFATHGIVIPEIPDMSALVLNQVHTGNRDDGFLRMPEISNLKINADLVVLSACETGLGRLYKGEGVVGLAQAFFRAGARSVITSLWSVSDESTTSFMLEVYKIVKNNKVTFSEALSKTKKAFSEGVFGEEWRKPYYWAPFVFYGYPVK